eukprot:TRINITY_DN124_c0_g1_i1.p1 TRINITY_DN124_c0_g1~~TRINITY_DN124_c0_g1_i1.p1  ORF type:complete len:307 (+),score=100.03 TRINITY_DN124_c0_g1_i1:67-987(+)
MFENVKKLIDDDLFEIEIEELKELKKLSIKEQEKVENINSDLENQIQINQESFNINSLVDIYEKILKFKNEISNEINHCTDETFKTYVNVSENILRIFLEEIRHIDSYKNCDSFSRTYVDSFKSFKNSVVNKLIKNIETVFLKFQSQKSNQISQSSFAFLFSQNNVDSHDVFNKTIVNELKDHFREALDGFNVALQMYQEDMTKKNNEWFLTVINKLHKSILHNNDDNKEIHNLCKEMKKLKKESSTLKKYQTKFVQKQAFYQEEIIRLLKTKKYSFKRSPPLLSKEEFEEVEEETGEFSDFLISV